MRSRYLLGIALAAATAVAACADDDAGSLTDGSRRGDSAASRRTPAGPTGNGDTNTPASRPGGDDTTPSGPVPTNSPAGKAFYKTDVHPFMAQKCGACHGTPGPGPAWITAADAETSYAQLFQVGYVVEQSRITLKPAHGGSTTNVLSGAEVQTYNQWVAMELQDGGQKAPPNVLEKLGACFDRQKFDAMQLGQWRTTRRTTNNNTNNVTPWNENANNCTGCDNAPCTTCHSADAATNFKNAVGNPLLPADSTFEETKLTNPAYITKYFGVSPEGKAIASDALKKKSEATKKDRAYTHPMYTLTANQIAALDAFVNDVTTKFNAGTCGQ
jgi:mono/diheme cytochrome c family protein